MAKNKTSISRPLRRSVLARDVEFVCVYCLAGRADKKGRIRVTLDHVQPESRGGKTKATNLVKCCRVCNDEKHVMPLDLWVQMLERDLGLAAGETTLRVFRQMFATL